MPRTVVLTRAATQRFEKALLGWWTTAGIGGKPGTDRIADALDCDRRTVMHLRNRRPVDRNMVIALFAAQSQRPLAKDYLALWELTDADFEETELSAEALRLITAGGQLYQAANYSLAEKQFQEALALYQRIGEKAGEASARLWLGRLELALGEFDRALAHIEYAFVINNNIKNEWMSADLHELKGLILLRQGKWEPCRENFLASLALWKKVNNLHAIADAEINLTGLEIAAKRTCQARIHLKNAHNAIETIRDAPLLASLLLREARLLLLEGQFEAAAMSAKQALDHWTFAKHPRWKAFSHLVLAEIAAAQLHTSDASHHAEISLKLYEQVGDRYGAQQARQLITSERHKIH